MYFYTHTHTHVYVCAWQVSVHTFPFCSPEEVQSLELEHYTNNTLLNQHS